VDDADPQESRQWTAYQQDSVITRDYQKPRRNQVPTCTYTVGRGDYNLARDSQSAVRHITRREKFCVSHNISPANKRRWNDRLHSNTYHEFTTMNPTLSGVRSRP
jgi:hypothetical protein